MIDRLIFENMPRLSSNKHHETNGMLAEGLFARRGKLFDRWVVPPRLLLDWPRRLHSWGPLMADHAQAEQEAII